MLEGYLVSTLDRAKRIIRLLIGVLSVLAFAGEGHGVFKILGRIAAVSFHLIADGQLSIGWRRHDQRIIRGYFHAVYPDGLPGRIPYVHLINFCSRQPCRCVNISFLQLIIPRIWE
ncbi:hypothetical protein D3C78_477750 [compost metagenome]